MTNRRDFLKQASMIVAGGFVGSSLLSSCGGANSAPKKVIGLQLYSLRDDIPGLGIKRVLELVAKMGYTTLEAAGYSDGLIYNTAPEEFKKMCDDLGLRLTSAHLCQNISEDTAKDMDFWKKATDCHAKAGLQYIVMPCCGFCGENVTADDVKRYGDYFTQIGQMTASASIKFGYHNHNAEFERKLDGVPVYDILLQSTSPNHVMFENDVYWCKKGGADPVEYLTKYPDRIQLLHIKDETAIGASGTIDFKPIFDKFYANGFKDYFVEVERYDEPKPEETEAIAKKLGLEAAQVSKSIADVAKSADFLAAAEYVK